jgi:hypothetical protein
MRRLLLGYLLLAATGAFAQDDEGAVPLDGQSRITVQGGLRLSNNDSFYDSFYALPDVACTEGCARASPPGPFAAVTFAYSVSDFIELGVDLFATQQRLALTQAPTITNTTYGALLGLRLQGLWEVLTPQGIVPFLGIETGPSLAYSVSSEGKTKELIIQPWVGTVGATFRLSTRWAVTAEYRLAFARGQSPFNTYEPDPALGLPKTPYKDLASFNAGGNWFALGLTYMFPPDPIRPFASP